MSFSLMEVRFATARTSDLHSLNLLVRADQPVANLHEKPERHIRFGDTQYDIVHDVRLAHGELSHLLLCL